MGAEAFEAVTGAIAVGVAALVTDPFRGNVTPPTPPVAVVVEVRLKRLDRLREPPITGGVGVVVVVPVVGGTGVALPTDISSEEEARLISGRGASDLNRRRSSDPLRLPGGGGGSGATGGVGVGS